jgi:DNA-binding NtrC family response regulator
MAFRHSDLGHLVHADPKAAARQIRAAMRAAGGVKARAAAALGIGRRTFDRYVSALLPADRAVALLEDGGGISRSHPRKATGA